ncbi:MAG: hypothetical protein HY774_12160 [Acidobacteria bacterium]|nr:hypothetical protein [Acidobacteriota bacterium]
MPILKNFAIIILGLIFISQTDPKQSYLQIHSNEHLKTLSNQLIAYIKSQEGEVILIRQDIESTSQIRSVVVQSFEVKEYYLYIGVSFYETQEQATGRFHHSIRTGRDSEGYILTNFGDEARGWNDGVVMARRGSVFVNLAVHLKPDSSQSRHQPLTEEEKQAKEELEYQQSQEAYNQLMKEPWVQSTTLPKRVPNYSPEHKLAQQFARYVLDFMDQYSKDQGQR